MSTAASDLLFRPVDELAGLVRDGEISPAELVQASLDRIGAADEQVNAFTHVDADGALATAGEIKAGDDRAFAGVPIAIKTEVAVKGLPLSFGSNLFGDYTPDQDSFVVARLRQAGFVIVGITTMPEMGIMPVTESHRFGPTRNPWDLERSPGGSSGGSASALAAGMVPIAHAADGGGSIRIPAACCGLVGLKPSRNRVSRGPVGAEHWLVTDGVLTRTVAETAALLDVISGYELGDANWAPPPAEPFAVAAAREPGKLRVAMTTLPPLDVPVHETFLSATQRAAELLESLGHDVEEVTPPWQAPGLDGMFFATFGAAISLAVLFGGIVTGREPTAELVEPLTWDIYEKSQQLSSTHYLAAMAQLQTISRGLISFFDPYDVVLTPSLAQPPVPVGSFDTNQGMDEWARAGEYAPFAALANVSGQPAISLPLYQGENGLPAGVHLIGRPAREDVLLSLAAQIESASPWSDRRPPQIG